MFLRPMTLQDEYFSTIEEEIQALFNRIIYAPLFLILGAKYPQELQNDKSLPALSSAIKGGAVWYDSAQFKGSFNSAISKELRSIGARWNPKGKTWSLSRTEVPPQVQMALAGAEGRFRAIQTDMFDALDSMQPATTIAKHSKTVKEYDRTIKSMDTNWRKTLSPAAKSISIPANLTETQREVIAKEWGQNLDIYIKDWAEQNILELRTKIQDNALTGGRAESMEKLIIENYGVSRRKAKFLARQETALLMSKFQETRYSGAGITEYKWSGANDERERKDHRILNGKVFRFDQPPVTNRKTGARNNPGGDYGCRCVAIPIAPFA